MGLSKHKLAILGGFVLGAILIGFTVSDVYADGRRARPTHYVLVQDVDITPTTNSVILSIGKPIKSTTEMTTTATTDVSATGATHCGMRCTSGTPGTSCSSVGVHSDFEATAQTDSLNYRWWGGMALVINRGNTAPAKGPSGTFFRVQPNEYDECDANCDVRPRPGTMLRQLTKVTDANDSGKCWETLEGTTYTFYKYTATEQ